MEQFEQGDECVVHKVVVIAQAVVVVKSKRYDWAMEGGAPLLGWRRWSRRLLPQIKHGLLVDALVVGGGGGGGGVGGGGGGNGLHGGIGMHDSVVNGARATRSVMACGAVHGRWWCGGKQLRTAWDGAGVAKK